MSQICQFFSQYFELKQQRLQYTVIKYIGESPLNKIDKIFNQIQFSLITYHMHTALQITS